MLKKLENPVQCQLFDFPGTPCSESAEWAVTDADGKEVPICREHLQAMAYLNSDNVAMVAPALIEDQE